MVVQKVQSSNSKRIEEIVVKELPQRYVSCGLRNWALLNADVVRLAEKLRGILPTRENVLPLLSSIVSKQNDGQLLSDTAPRPSAGCGSHVLPQKRLLEEEYAICYPTTNKRSRELFPCQSSSTFVNTQEVDDFKLAVELQYEENMTCSESNNFQNSTDCGVSGDHMDETNNAAMDETNNAAAALISLNNIGGINN